MRGFGTVSTAVATATLFASSVLGAVDPIVIKGSKFFFKTNGTEFFIKGVAYQQDIGSNGGGSTSGGSTFIDPLADPAGCARDASYMQSLGLNAIRVYAVDPTQDHSACMQTFDKASIYLVVDLSAPGTSINRNTPTWDDTLYARYTSVIDDFQKYNNVLGFFAGNEVTNSLNTTAASAFVKAAVRDMKAYIKNQGYRSIGVGYATSDDQFIRVNVADYFDCGSRASSVDFWGYNIYSWCGNSTFQQSGYADRTEQFSSFNIPVFFAEYGCNAVEPREFTEVLALYGPQMTPVWSGGIVYEWFQEVNKYGLVSVSGSSVSTLPDYAILSSQLSKATPTGTNMNDYAPTNTAAQSCPTVGPNWGASSNLPPTPNKQLCDCMEKAVTCVPSNKVNNENIGEFFGVLCGLSKAACAGTAANGTTGTYGAYGMCSPQQQLAWALNVYYEEQQQAGNGASACAFSGSATTQSAASPTGTCASLISQAGAAGTGTVTSAPSSHPAGSSGSGSSSSGAAVAGQSTIASLNLGAFHIGLYLVCAMVSGAGMILL